MIEVVLNDRLGKKIRVKCNEDDTIGDLKKLAAAQLGTRPEKLKIQKWCVVWFSPTVFLVSAPNDGEIDGTPWQGSETFDIFNSRTHAWTWTNSPNSTGIPYIKTTLHLRTMRYTTAWGLNCEWNFVLETTSWNTSQLIFYWSDFARPSHVLANQNTLLCQLLDLILTRLARFFLFPHHMSCHFVVLIKYYGNNRYYL